MRFKFVIFCAFVGQIITVVHSAKTEPVSDKKFCGFQHIDDYFRTRNGTSIDEFPWLAGLIYKYMSDGAGALLCSGTLINRRYILTAAQCLTHPKETVLVKVRLGEYHLKNVTDCVGELSSQDLECSTVSDFGIEEKLIHPQYNRQTRANDIALLRLDRSISEFTDYIRPICVFGPGSWYANVGATLFTSGWGRQGQDTEPVEIKKKIYTNLITNEQCAKEFPGLTIIENHICTRDLANNTDFTCQGDAGSPVMHVYGSVKQWHLEGVSSWGGPCGSNSPRVHTRVVNYYGWIQENIRD